MIDIVLNKTKGCAPYELFQKYYLLAEENNQPLTEAISISSYCKKNEIVSSRFVNIKYIKDEEWTFFSNYQSKKSIDFDTHKQIAGLFFWHKINVQIRLYADIKKSDDDLSNKHFVNRSPRKNALSICSNQSQVLENSNTLIEKYEYTLNHKNLKERPDFWGGYTFKPYYFEFWEGNNDRLNKRVAFKKNKNSWNKNLLWP